jgi:pimeloyl-ACP methyl ester carboxylesterase
MAKTYVFALIPVGRAVMMLRKPVIECLYGWGQLVQVYDDYLDISGRKYALDELVSVCPVYHRMMGISSVRLVLHFKRKKVILRGIAAIATAQKIVAWLKEYLQVTGEYNLQAYARSTTTQTRVPRWQLNRQLQRARKLKQAQVERAKREHGFDVEQLAQRLHYGPLPQIYVPTRLLAGEYAHYCTDATLREEPLPGSMQPGYQIKDQGMLILTSKRILYIGRRRQPVLSYNHLLHISHLQGAIAILSETWARREIFEMRLPLECTMYLNAILLRYRQQNIHLEQFGVSASVSARHSFSSS